MPASRRPRDPLLAAADEPATARGDAALKDPGLERRHAAEQERAVEHLARGDLRSYLRALGPGIISGGSDDDPSAIATFSQAGSRFGFGLLWTALLTFPLMAAVQELCARIAMQSGVGLGVALRRRFPRPLVGACVAGLVLSNLITLGADLGAVAAGVSLLSRGRLHPVWLVAPVAMAVVVLQLRATYEIAFRIFKWLTLTLFAYVLAGVLAHPPAMSVLRATFTPHLEMGSAFLLMLAAVVGTAFSPYVMFWEGSLEVEELERAGQLRDRGDRGVDRAHMRAARVDVFSGMFFAQLVMYFVILTAGAVLHAHGVTNIDSAEQAAAALQPLAGPAAFVLFAVGLIGAGMLAVPVLSGTTAYAIKEFAGIPGSLEVRPRAAPTFYALLVGSVLVGLVMNFMGVNVIQALVVASAVGGVVAGPLIVLATLLGSDRRVMGRWTSGPLSRTLTWVAGALVSLVALAWLCSPLLDWLLH